MLPASPARRSRSTTCISWLSRPHALSSGWCSRVASSTPHAAGDGCSAKRWTSRCSATAAQHVEVADGQAGEAEEAEALGQLHQRRVGDERAAPVLGALRGAGLPERGAQPAPQLGLPADVVGQVARDAVGVAAIGVVPRGPREDHLGPVHGVAVEEVGEVAHGGEAAVAVGVAAVGVVAAGRACPDVAGEHVEPRLGEVRVDDVEQGPGEALGSPGIGGGVDAGDLGDDLAARAARETGSRGWRTPRRSTRPSEAPSRAASWWASQRSTPRECTATISSANGSATGSARGSPRARHSTSARAARASTNVMPSPPCRVDGAATGGGHAGPPVASRQAAPRGVRGSRRAPPRAEVR